MIRAWGNFFRSLRAVLRCYKGLIALIYLIQIALASTIGLQVYQVIEASIGHSLSLEILIDKFDYSTFYDFFNIHGASLSPLLGLLRWLILLYLLISVFIQAGAMGLFLHYSGSFWQFGARYFRSFLTITALTYLVSTIILIMIWFPFVSGIFKMMETWLHEEYIVWLFFGLVTITLIVILLMLSIGLMSKGYYIREGCSVISALRHGLLSTFSNGQNVSLALLYLLLVFLTYLLGYFLEKYIGITSLRLIITFIFIQQLIILIKVSLRLSLYHSFTKKEEALEIKSLG